MEPITKADLILNNSLCSRTYTGYKLLSNAKIDEQDQLNRIKNKLKTITKYFSNKYATSYGPFETSISSGNPITRRNTFQNVWGGLFKGAPNKQYAAQISFVLNRKEPCLDVGFYFGRAAGRSQTKEERAYLEQQLQRLGISLSDSIRNNISLNERYNNGLFDFGFKAYSNGAEVSPENWPEIIRNDTKDSQIIAKIYPNDFNTIDNSTIDSFVAQIIFLMSAIDISTKLATPISIKPLTPEQRAKQAERLSQIGLKGELFIMKKEREKLILYGFNNPNYPRHVALESTHFGYDILSLDENNKEIFIEVKTTTRKNDDPLSKKIFVSSNEFDVFSSNKEKYRVLRVYDIEGTPVCEILDLQALRRKVDGYIFEY